MTRVQETGVTDQNLWRVGKRVPHYAEANVDAAARVTPITMTGERLLQSNTLCSHHCRIESTRSTGVSSAPLLRICSRHSSG
jgi:hypothetical protein